MTAAEWALFGGWCAAGFAWGAVGWQLRHDRWIRRWHFLAGCGVLNLLFGGFGWWLVTGEWGWAGTALAVFYGWRAWRRRDDDDDNDRWRRRWAAAKTRIPRPTVVALRPVEQT